MRRMTHRGVLLLASAIGLAACDGRSPAEPTPKAPDAPLPPSALTVTAISPSTGSTARPTPVVISGTGFLAGATVTVDVAAVMVRIVNSTTITATIPAHAAGHADVVVTNPGGPGGALPAAFTYSFEEPFTLTPSVNTIEPGGQITLTWTAPAGRVGDWIALCRVGGGYEDDWYGLTKGATSGTDAVTAPARPGQYEFRYLLDDGFVDVARSSPVTVR